MVFPREEIPGPKAGGAIFVDLPALYVAKIELYRAMRAEGVGKAGLAKRLGVALPQIDRLLDMRHNSRLDAIERALACLGRTMTIVSRRREGTDARLGRDVDLPSKFHDRLFFGFENLLLQFARQRFSVGSMMNLTMTIRADRGDIIDPIAIFLARLSFRERQNMVHFQIWFAR